MTPFVKNPRLSRFFACFSSLLSGTGEVTLVPLTCVSSGVGLAIWERDIGPLNQGLVEGSNAGVMPGGIKTETSRS